ncbi:methionine biosynthesis protein MetW [Desulfonatronovibrio hydrogenovorans]|uniref:methionine biosynthesis protein MetW n=1 Tax=Desulfonatronovibrio hydrogenovorans TaxID=53245 RepID=UPI000691B4B6|nr:methionine biosynthesis protein MetW [Desulfonatronovibrio hydrogenovorans]
MKSSTKGFSIDWSKSLDRDRYFDPFILKLAKPQDQVLDLGCGRGELLLELKRHKQINELGIELDSEYVADCLSRGLRVIQGDLEESVADFGYNHFDLVILNQVLLSVASPLQLLRHSLRIGRKVAVTFPNFAHWRVRMQILFKGRLPVNRDLPYEWHETPNIRLATVDDFTALCKQIRADITHKHFAGQGPRKQFSPITLLPNLRSSLALFCLSDGTDSP